MYFLNYVAIVINVLILVKGNNVQGVVMMMVTLYGKIKVYNCYFDITGRERKNKEKKK